jgi:thiol-disulfide isomerase/thioredoxin
MKNTTGKLEVLTNVMIIIAAVALLWVIGTRFIFPLENNNVEIKKAPKLGTFIKIEGFDSSRAKLNILLVLQKGCHYCEESMPFYRKLVSDSKNKNLRIIAVFPPAEQKAEQYLNESGLFGVEVLGKRLDELDISGTPTLIVTNNKGEIIATWIGILSAEKQSEAENLIKSYSES